MNNENVSSKVVSNDVAFKNNESLIINSKGNDSINQKYESTTSVSKDNLMEFDDSKTNLNPRVDQETFDNGSSNYEDKSEHLKRVFSQSQLDDYSYMPDGYSFNNKGQLIFNDGKSLKILGYAVRIVKRYKSLEDGKESYLGQYIEPYNNCTHTFKADASIFIPSGYHDLISTGLPFTSNKMSLYQDYFFKQKSHLPVHLKYSDIGWDQIDDCLVFKGKNIISEDDNISGFNDLKKYDLSSKGTYEEWSHMYDEFVKPYPALQLGVVLGLASTIVPLIHRYVDSKLINIFIHASGSSSSGKTTVASLIASVCGSTLGHSTSLMRNWDATDNAITDLTGNNGCALILDELGMNRRKDLTRVVFSLAQGRDKAKKTSSSEMMDTKGWSTLIFSTGESSISRLAHGYEGINVRLLEIEDMQFTPNAYVADSISNITSEQFGTVQPIFVKFLMENNNCLNDIATMYKNDYKKLIKFLPQNRLTSRINKILTTIVLTAELANQCFNFGIDINGLINLLLKHSFNKNSVSMADKAWDETLQWLLQHQSQIKINMNSSYVKSSILGFGTNHVEYYQFDVFTSCLKNFLLNRGFKDLKRIFSDWKNDNHLITAESDRNISRKYTSGIRDNYYSIRVDADMDKFVIFKDSFQSDNNYPPQYTVSPEEIFSNPDDSTLKDIDKPKQDPALIKKLRNHSSNLEKDLENL